MSANLVMETVLAHLGRFAPQGAHLRQDSRNIKTGDVFVAFSGDVHDGRDHVDAAFKAGASCVMAELDGLDEAKKCDRRIIGIKDLKHKLGSIANAFYGEPSTQLDGIAVTGTNGKSTVIAYCAQLLQALQGKPAAVVGTLGAGLLGDAPTTGLTTPQASDMQRVLAQCAAQGAGSVSVEASSIGIEEGRLNGTQFKVAAFTNLSQDHLDYHGTMQAYGAAKQRLFDWAGLQAAVINVDDAFGAQLWASLHKTNLQNTNLQNRSQPLQRLSTGLADTAMLRASDVCVKTDASQTFTVHYMGVAYPAQLSTLGTFNVHNALTALGCVLALGYDIAAAIALLPRLDAVAGRMQRVLPVGLAAQHAHAQAQALVIIDYAHTPDGLKSALQALRPVAQTRGGSLHVVFGCGGDRDASKRPAMGAVAQQYADRITITNDNPRGESPAIIAAHIAATAPTAAVVLDRAQAIAQAIAQAQTQDVVLIAGKGHETTQIIGAMVQPFSDVAHAQQALGQRISGAAR